MKNNNLILSLLIAAMALPLSMQSASGSAATTFPSLKLERGARAAAMGGAYVAAADGIDAMFYNPAGLAGLRRLELFAGHNSWIEGISDQQIAFGMPWYGMGAWGFSATYLSAMTQGRDDFGQPTQDVGIFDFTAQASLTIEWNRYVSTGASYRLMRQGYTYLSSMGSSFDFGIQIRKLMDRKLTLGFSTVNMGTEIALGESLTPLPWETRAGAALELFSRRLLLSAELGYQPHTFFTKTRLGMEVALPAGSMNTALRAGYVIGPQQQAGGMSGLNLGGGVGLGGIDLDYSWQPVGDFGDSHRVSLTYTFD